MLTEETVIDQITVTDTGQILVREKHRVLRDGTEIAFTYHRSSYEPGDQTVNQKHPTVAAIADVVWTPEVLQAAEARKA